VSDNLLGHKMRLAHALSQKKDSQGKLVQIRNNGGMKTVGK